MIAIVAIKVVTRFLIALYVIYKRKEIAKISGTIIRKTANLKKRYRLTMFTVVGVFSYLCVYDIYESWGDNFLYSRTGRPGRCAARRQCGSRHGPPYLTSQLWGMGTPSSSTLGSQTRRHCLRLCEIGSTAESRLVTYTGRSVIPSYLQRHGNSGLNYTHHKLTLTLFSRCISAKTLPAIIAKN